MAKAFAVYSADDGSFNFYKRDTVPSAGDTFEGKTATNVYTGVETWEFFRASDSPYNSIRTYITSVSIVDEIAPISTAYWIYNCTSLTSIDLSGLDTSNVTDMGYMFYNCSSLTSIDLGGLDTSNVTDMGYMFYNCSSLTSLDLSGLNTSNVTSMSFMFYNCSGLTSLDLSSFDTSNVTGMSNMFYNCSGLTSLDLSGFDTSSVPYMSSMFEGCSGLTSLDLSELNTSSVTDTDEMFYNCSGLTSLDLSSFDTSNVTHMGGMFRGCSGLTTIYASVLWSTDRVTGSDYMFTGCTALVGDIAFDSTVTDVTYATTNGGYLTYKAYAPPEFRKDFFVKGETLYRLAHAIRRQTGGTTGLTPDEMAVAIPTLGDWVGTLTFSGTYATSTYFTEAGCSLAVDHIRGMAFVTIQGGTSSSYENVLFNVAAMPAGVKSLKTPNRTDSGTSKGSYYTKAFTGITGKINVSVNFSAIDSSYDYVQADVTITYA